MSSTHMLECAANASRTCFLFVGIFCVLFVFLLYIFFLYGSALWRRTGTPLHTRRIIHHFYIALSCGTVAVTMLFATFFPVYFYTTGVVFLCLLLLCVSMVWLRFTQPFCCVVISEQLPVVPLLCSLLVTITAMGCTFFAFHVEAHCLANVSQLYMVTQAVEHIQINDLGGANENNSRIPLSSPLENHTTPTLPAQEHGWFAKGVHHAAKFAARDRMHQLMEKPTAGATIRAEKEMWAAISDPSNSSAAVYHPDQVGVQMAGNAIVIKPVEIEKGGFLEKAVGLCYEKKGCTESTAVMSDSWFAKPVWGRAIVHEQGCVLLTRGPEQGPGLITEPVKIFGGKDLIIQKATDSPRSLSPPPFDSQSTGWR